jgi:D-3-phosphoglycerate dehydrogenase / 2-oxoglutarate reductase
MPQNRPKILVAESEGFPVRAAELLYSFGDVRLADLDRGGLLTAIKDTEVLWVRLRHQIDSEAFNSARSLKAIVTPTTGLNHIDLKEAKLRGVRIVSLQGESEFLRDVRATAEHTLALIFMILRKIPSAVAHVKEGGWNRDLFKGHELHGKAIGIVGYGRLGGIVARYLKALDARILISDPNAEPGTTDPGLTMLPLRQLLERADIVTLHVNLCEETLGFFGSKEFATMKPGAWFINTSRGELVDEQALLTALRSSRLAGAAVDVLCAENSGGMAGHPLVAYARDHDNLIITPHIGGCTVESLEKTELFLAQKLCCESRFTSTSDCQASI